MGVGTWSWGSSFFWGYGRTHDETDTRAAFRTSLEAGINYFDTAEAYGNGRSELLLGQMTRDVESPIIVSTKFFPFPWRLRERSIRRALKASLIRLGMSTIDLYLIHWPSPPVSIETWMAGLADAVESKMARSVGVSNYNVEQLRRARAALAERRIPLACNQVNFSLLQPKKERESMLEACRELDVTLVAYSPLAQGLLTGKYGPSHPPPWPRRWRIDHRLLTRLEDLIGLMTEIGQGHDGKLPAQVALNWVICKGAVPIPGAKNARQAQENAGAMGWQLTDDEITALDQASERVLV
jgi:aryl-alcohol dehydrogenase-like predicted oxidoreductase